MYVVEVTCLQCQARLPCQACIHSECHTRRENLHAATTNAVHDPSPNTIAERCGYASVHILKPRSIDTIDVHSSTAVMRAGSTPVFLPRRYPEVGSEFHRRSNNSTPQIWIDSSKVGCVPRTHLNVLICPRILHVFGTVIYGACLSVATNILRTQPKRITEVDRIPVCKPVEVEPTGQPNRVFLRICPGRRVRVRLRRRNQLRLLPLAAHLTRILIVICTKNRRRALSGGSGVERRRRRISGLPGDGPRISTPSLLTSEPPDCATPTSKHDTLQCDNEHAITRKETRLRNWQHRYQRYRMLGWTCRTSLGARSISRRPSLEWA